MERHTWPYLPSSHVIDFDILYKSTMLSVNFVSCFHSIHGIVYCVVALLGALNNQKVVVVNSNNDISLKQIQVS